MLLVPKFNKNTNQVKFQCAKQTKLFLEMQSNIWLTNITAAPHICSVPKLAWLISIPLQSAVKHVMLFDGFYFKSTVSFWITDLLNT